jgi:hypothetical protein
MAYSLEEVERTPGFWEGIGYHAMSKRLAHQLDYAPSIPEEPLASGDPSEVFRWNRTDASQFTLLDPLSQGWSLSYQSSGPAHLLLSAPPSWSDSTGPVFILVEGLQVLERQVVVVHDLFPGAYEQAVGPVLRFLSEDSWVGCRWKVTIQGQTVTRTMEVAVEDGGVPQNLSVASGCEILEGAILKTTATSSANLYGVGRGVVSGYGAMAGSEDLHVEPTVGFGVWFLDDGGDHGGESLRIFDFVVREGGGRA